MLRWARSGEKLYCWPCYSDNAFYTDYELPDASSSLYLERPQCPCATQETDPEVTHYYEIWVVQNGKYLEIPGLRGMKYGLKEAVAVAHVEGTSTCAIPTASLQKKPCITCMGPNVQCGLMKIPSPPATDLLQMLPLNFSWIFLGLFARHLRDLHFDSGHGHMQRNDLRSASSDGGYWEEEMNGSEHDTGRRRGPRSISDKRMKEDLTEECFVAQQRCAFAPAPTYVPVPFMRHLTREGMKALRRGTYGYVGRLEDDMRGGCWNGRREAWMGMIIETGETGGGDVKVPEGGKIFGSKGSQELASRRRFVLYADLGSSGGDKR
ncbi:hypothetical protein JB92DRAFT_2826390 [Gautieria morchelliformis]|nr:hypothetical protein JB92DRAFT_2826390 [Gautieria morchelliformis]